jgi:hypothetical protein
MILPYRDFRSALAKIEVEEAVVVEGSGHMPQLDYPVEFAGQYQRFLFGVWAAREEQAEEQAGRHVDQPSTARHRAAEVTN